MHWYERFISPLSLIAGFIADNLFLTRRVDLWQTNALLLTYLAVAAIAIALIHLVETGRITEPSVLRAAPLVPVVMQFSIGGLLSGFLSLYSRSAGFAASWLFVIVVAMLLIGNERFLRFYTRLPFQMGIYYFTLFSFLIFFLPVVFHAIGPMMFVSAGVTSLVTFAALFALLAVLVPETVRRERARVWPVVVGVFFVLNALYFGGFFPTLPLALKNAGVYHSFALEGADIHLGAEQGWWYAPILSLFSYSTTFHTAAGGTAYVYSAIFAPTGLTTTIVNEWQRYDAGQGAWVTVADIPYDIVGGSEGGYRGYTYDSNLTPGRWRVNIETSYGQIIGRVYFTVDTSPGAYPLLDVMR